MKEKFKMDKHDLVLLYFDENDNYWGTDIHIFTMFYYIDIKVSPYPGYTGSRRRRYGSYLPGHSRQRYSRDWDWGWLQRLRTY